MRKQSLKDASTTRRPSLNTKRLNAIPKGQDMKNGYISMLILEPKLLNNTFINNPSRTLLAI